MITITLDLIRKRLAKKTPTIWSAKGNLPFYAVLDKPAPSLSKHDHIRPSLWRPEDVEFVLLMANGGTQFLLDEIERLQRQIRILETPGLTLDQ